MKCLKIALQIVFLPATMSLLSACVASDSDGIGLSAPLSSSPNPSQPSNKSEAFCNALEKGMDKATVMHLALAAGANPDTTRWKTDSDGRETLMVAIPSNRAGGCLVVMNDGRFQAAAYISRERE